VEQASNDQSVLDLEIANKLGWCVFSIIQILGTIGVMSQVAWPVFAIFVPVTVVCFLCQVWTLKNDLLFIISLFILLLCAMNSRKIS
jgi:hypothetical protein